MRRTFAHIALFANRGFQDMLRRVLVVWAREHTRAGYKQGMSELLAMVLCQALAEHRVWQHALRAPGPLDPPLDLLAVLVDARYVEHDAYWLLDAMMARLTVVYIPEETPFTPVGASASAGAGAGASGDCDAASTVPGRPAAARGEPTPTPVLAPATPRRVPKFRQWLRELPAAGAGTPPPAPTPARATHRPRLMTPGGTGSSLVRRLDHIQGSLLSRFDPALNAHLCDIGVEPSMYLLRWLRLVFARELAMVPPRRVFVRVCLCVSVCVSVSVPLFV